jgi:hypothetical protein
MHSLQVLSGGGDTSGTTVSLITRFVALKTAAACYVQLTHETPAHTQCVRTLPCIRARRSHCGVCVLCSRHETPARSRSLELAAASNVSRVRIDRLGYRVASCEQHCLNGSATPAGRAIQQGRAVCIEGAKRGERGYAMPDSPCNLRY